MISTALRARARATPSILSPLSVVSVCPYLSASFSSSAPSPPSLPDSCNVLVVGGGVIGCSTAYHLSKMGVSDVVLLERHQLTSGTTWHAAGLMVTFGSLSHTSTEFRKYTKHLYSEVLEKETGASTGFKPCGFIELATSPEHLEEYRRIAAFNRFAGVDVQEISPAEVAQKFPLINTDGVLAGFYVEDDGRVNPYDATMAFAKGARHYGAKLFENVEVADLLKTDIGTHQRKEVAGVRTVSGHEIKANVVVNAGGMWARQFGEMAGGTEGGGSLHARASATNERIHLPIVTTQRLPKSHPFARTRARMPTNTARLSHDPQPGRGALLPHN